jgi:hypothetical protein
MTALEKIQREACEWCGKGMPIDVRRYERTREGEFQQRALDLRRCGEKIGEPPMHITGMTDYSTFNVPNKWVPCTAPSAETLVEQQDVRIKTLEAELARCEAALEATGGYSIPSPPAQTPEPEA